MIEGLIRLAVGVSIIIGIVVFAAMFLKMPFENIRKLFHFAFLGLSTVWLFAFDDWKTSALTMLIFIPAAYLILCLFDRIPLIADHLPQRKNGEFKQSLMAASTMYIISVVLGWGLLKERGLALAAIYAWGPGDAAAALIGKRYGKTKIGKRKIKSLEGSLSMFVVSFIFVAAILKYCNLFTGGNIILVSFLTSLATTITELFVLSGYDTLFCPVTAIIVLCLCRYLIK